MNEALAHDLYLKYPKILKSEAGNEVSLDVSDGWYDLLDILCSQVQHHIDWKNGAGEYSKYRDSRKEGESVPQLTAVQVKEKFGALRFYIYGGNEEIWGAIRMAEAMSHKICENCGIPGYKQPGGWIRTLCDPCQEKRLTRKLNTDELIDKIRAT